MPPKPPPGKKPPPKPPSKEGKAAAPRPPAPGGHGAAPKKAAPPPKKPTAGEKKKTVTPKPPGGPKPPSGGQIRYVDFVRQEFKKVEGDAGMINMLKNNLKLDPDYKEPTNDDRLLNIQTITLEFKDHKVAQVVSLRTKAEQRLAVHQHSDNAKVTVKEGGEFKVRVNFRAQHFIIPGLKVTSTVKRMGQQLALEETRLGSYNPTTAFQDIYLPRDGFTEAPSGYLYRGTYYATLVFASDTNDNLLTVNYQVIVDKKYASR